MPLTNPWPSNSRSNMKNLEMLIFVEGGKRENPEKNPRSKDENQQQTQPFMTPGPGFEPRPHWREVSTIITAPSLLPHGYNQLES